MFVVPAFTESQRKIPFARVNHNKYMVTDKTAYIGTITFCYVLLQLLVSCQIESVVKDVSPRDTYRRVVMRFTQLTRHETNNCTNTFMHMICLSNIFIRKTVNVLSEGLGGSMS
jgi:hypothetical protein